jgi:hypothetical protein
VPGVPGNMPRMTRLQDQYQRLYLHPASSAAEAPGLLGPQGQVRALVLALGRPADWATLVPVWRGVQADLAWPAPGIAVNGADAFELWFSLAQPVPLSEAVALLRGLQQRYLPGIRPERVRLWPTAEARPWAAPLIPALQAPERWSAFVAPDLAAVFGGDDPSLDFEPGADAQAELLARLRPVSPAELDAARALFAPGEPAAAAPPAHAAAMAGAPGATPGIATSQQDPRAFLLAVMNDPAVPLALRIEAAKGLLRP